MKNNLYFAIKDFKRNLVSIIIFIGQLTISIFFIFLSITQLMANEQYGNLIKKLSDYNLIYFNAYYGVEGMSITPEMNKKLIEVLDNNQKGFSVIENLKLPQYPNLNIIVGLGRFGEIFELDSNETQGNKNNNDTKVLVGSKVKDVNVGETIRFGLSENEELIINARLPRNVSYLKRQTAVSLDNSIVILTTFEKLNQAYANYYIVPVITNMSLLNSNNEEINEFVKTISESKMLNLSPDRFNSIAPDVYRDTMLNSLFFLLFFLATIIFISLGIVSSLLTLIDHNLQEYAVHRLYGATLIDLYWRTIIYVMSIIVLPLISTAVLVRFAALEYFSPLYIISLGIITIVSFSYFPLSKLKRHDMTFYLRRDY